MNVLLKTVLIGLAMAAVGGGSLYAQAADSAASHRMHKHHMATMGAAASPAPAAKAASTHKKALAPQTTCPVMGEPINKDIYVDYKGKRVYFCCNMCPETFKKDPEKYLKKLADMGQAPQVIDAMKDNEGKWAK
jgi:YHS domain-containing protein